jgi:DNA-binding NarL/FixJ family response regulator
MILFCEECGARNDIDKNQIEGSSYSFSCHACRETLQVSLVDKIKSKTVQADFGLETTVSDALAESEPLNVLVVDDSKMIRRVLCDIINSDNRKKVVGEAANGKEACQLAAQVEPDVVVMDINMPVLDGVQATHYITEAKPETGVIILTMYRQDQHVFEAIKAGARAYLLKDADSEELLRAIRVVATGEALLDSAIALKMMDEFRRLQGDAAGTDGITPLTERELDILRLVAQGLDNSDIGHQLGLSEKTIRNRLTTIFEKLHVNNRIQAALYALRQGLASLNGEDS